MKLILALALVAVTTPSHAASRLLHSFLGVPSITVSNTANITNLVLVTGGTNMTGVVFTNIGGPRVVIGTTTNTSGALVGLTTPLIGTVPISPLTVPVQPAINETSYTNYQGNLAIVIKGVGGSGANTAMTLRFTPMFGNNAATAASEQFLWAVTPTTTTEFVIRTNIALLNKFNNATGIRLDFIAAGDTDASSQVQINALDVVQIW